jgi:hypothetical protein
LNESNKIDANQEILLSILQQEMKVVNIISAVLKMTSQPPMTLSGEPMMLLVTRAPQKWVL